MNENPVEHLMYESSFDEKIEEFFKICRKNDLKITPQRTEIYKILLNSKEHPSAEMVCEKVRPILPNISLDTVNRTLKTLRWVGLAFAVEGSGDSMRFDANFDGHQHFKCIECKRIIDFEHEPFKNIEIPAEFDEEFKVTKISVYAEGLCKNCINQENQKNNA